MFYLACQVRYQLFWVGIWPFQQTFVYSSCLLSLFKVAELQKKSYLLSHQVLTSVVCIVVWSLCLQQNTRSCIKDDYLWQSYRTGNHLTIISIAKCLGKWQLQRHQRNNSVLFLEQHKEELISKIVGRSFYELVTCWFSATSWTLILLFLTFLKMHEH